ncbi:MAG: type II toxin-antitoxin system RelE/ParE family toxin [Fusobacteriaceae bacterium]|nr:type II toxin-antitoxin system RelE/ParE family toxin [Fusobacteriaceae bacterium]
MYYPPAKKFFKKLKDKTLKEKFKEAIDEIRNDYNIGSKKVGDLAGIYGYDIYYNKTNYEIAYTINTLEDGTVVVIIMAGTRENFWNELKKYLKYIQIKGTASIGFWYPLIQILGYPNPLTQKCGY